MSALEEVLADVDATFGYSEDSTYQARAHKYLDERGLGRTATDTAVQATVRNVAQRAFDAGRRQVLDELGEARTLAMRLAEVSGVSWRLAEMVREATGGDQETW